jgi:hypothetical protein
MNERIRELAEQAGIDFFNSTDPEYCGREYCEAWTEQQQKFAELIVQECADIAKHHVMNISTYADAEFVEKQIRDHFGIKGE